MPSPPPPAPPPWLKDTIVHVTKCMEVARPVRTLVFMHDNEETWHLDVFPSTYEEDGETFWDGFEVDVFELLKGFDQTYATRMHVNTDGLDMTASWAGNIVHVVLHFDPAEETEGLAAIIAGGVTPPNPSPLN